jgi:hypothetical protein
MYFLLFGTFVNANGPRICHINILKNEDLITMEEMWGHLELERRHTPTLNWCFALNPSAPVAPGRSLPPRAPMGPHSPQACRRLWYSHAPIGTENVSGFPCLLTPLGQYRSTLPRAHVDPHHIELPQMTLAARFNRAHMGF